MKPKHKLKRKGRRRNAHYEHVENLMPERRLPPETVLSTHEDITSLCVCMAALDRQGQLVQAKKTEKRKDLIVQSRP